MWIQNFVEGCLMFSSQPAMIPSSHSMLSRDKLLLRDTWNQSGLQENVCRHQLSYV